MIDKIEITINDNGFFVINFGGVLTVITDNIKEMLITIAEKSKHLTYFPNTKDVFQQTKPITFLEFKKLKKQ